MNGWKEQLKNFPVRIYQQFRIGANATDNSIIMDVVELIHTNKDINSICIASTDSDFYGLALRLRESGLYVIGMGRREAKNIWVNSCNQFIYIDNIQSKTDTEIITACEKPDKAQIYPIDHILRYAFENISNDDDDWIRLSHLGTSIRSRYPNFDVRNYNYRSLTDLLKAVPEIVEISNDECTPPNYFARLKSSSNPPVVISSGVVKRKLPGFGIIQNTEGDFFFSNINVDISVRNQIKKGDKVIFTILKMPDQSKETNEEKNGKAIDIKLEK